MWLIIFLILLLSAAHCPEGFAQSGSVTDAAAFVAHFESGGNPTATDPRSTASGLFGFLNGTWASYAPQAGVSVAQYPTAGSAPASVQMAVFAADYNQNGLKDWTCTGCDAPLVQALGKLGGTSALTPVGTLSVNPSAYTSLDQPDALRQYFADAGLPADSNPGSGATPGNTGAASGGANQAALNSVFQNLWYQLTVVIQPQINLLITRFETLASGVLSGLLLLAIMFAALRVALHHETFDRILPWFIKAGVIVSFIGIGSGYYNSYVVLPVQQLPTWWQSYLPGAALGVTTPVAMLDWVNSTTNATYFATKQALSYLDVGGAISIALGRGLTYVSLLVMFLAKAGMTIVAGVTLTIGALMLLAGLFPRTEYMLWGWVSVLVTALLSLLGMDIVLSLYGVVMVNLIQSLGPGETSVWIAAGVVFVFASSVGALPMVWRRIGGGVSASLNSARHWMSGEPVIVAAAAGAGMVAGAGAIAAGGNAAAAGLVSRWVRQVGPSLSRLP